MATTASPNGRKRPSKAARATEPLVATHPESGVRAAIHIGDCRELIPTLPDCRKSQVDLVFADPPFNWNRKYDQWVDRLPDAEYLAFTYEWLDRCVESLAAHGSIWVNIPDDWAAEIVVYLKSRHKLAMINWCIWHYRFGQNNRNRFINSKVHALYFCKDPAKRTFNVDEVLEPSDRATTYFDPRTMSKRDGMPSGLRLPMDVWYGKYWGRIQGNNKERRASHDNQLPEVYLQRVIRACSNEGDLVMDPFTGSGTTGVVAHALGRNFIGCEYSRAMAKSAMQRIGAGMVRPLDAANQSTAIFAARNAGDATRLKFSAFGGR